MITRGALTTGEIEAPTPARYGAPALEKGLDILECLAAAGGEQSQKEIAAAVGRTPNETYRMLAVLEARRYVLRDPNSGLYGLSLRLFQLAHSHSPWETVRRGAQGPLRELATTVFQSCHLAALHEDNLLILASQRSPAPVALTVEAGATLPLLSTASGRVILSGMPEQEREQLLGRLPLPIGSDPASYRAELGKIRTQGYLVSASDLTHGVTDISVPVGTSKHGLRLALTLPCLETSLARKSTHTEIIAAAQGCAGLIAVGLGLE